MYSLPIVSILEGDTLADGSKVVKKIYHSIFFTNMWIEIVCDNGVEIKAPPTLEMLVDDIVLTDESQYVILNLPN